MFCLDNDAMYAEKMIYEIEKRTRMNFQDIQLKGTKKDFRGLRFSTVVGNVIFGKNFQAKRKLKEGR